MTVSDNMMCSYKFLSFLSLFSAGVLIVRKERYPFPQDIPEGRWAVYEVSLPSKPTHAVTITFRSLSHRMSLGPASMLFEPDTWNVAQDLVIYALEDTVNFPSPYPASFNMSLSSIDNNFNEYPLPNFNLTVEDNDEGMLCCTINIIIIFVQL